jgi:hypothetical protein
MHIAPKLVFALLLVASTSHAQDRTTDPLQGITLCIGSSEFRAATKERLPASITSRNVDAAQGPMPVSLADGYRMMLYRKSSEPLVNLKIERSIDGKFDADRAAIMLQMDRISAASTGPRKVAVERSTQDGIEVAGLNNSAIGTPGVISLYQLFDAPTGTIATAYLLNQAPAVREYKTQAEYDVLRERFVGVLSKCMAHRTR